MLLAEEERDLEKARAEEATLFAEEALYDMKKAENAAEKIGAELREKSYEIEEVKTILENTQREIQQLQRQGRNRRGFFTDLGNFVDRVICSVLPC